MHYFLAVFAVQSCLLINEDLIFKAVGEILLVDEFDVDYLIFKLCDPFWLDHAVGSVLVYQL